MKMNACTLILKAFYNKSRLSLTHHTNRSSRWAKWNRRTDRQTEFSSL